MKTLTNLSGDIVDAKWTAPLQSTTINVGNRQDFVRHVQLSSNGVMVRRRGLCVGISIAELVRWAESVEPDLIPPPEKPKEQPPA